MFEGIFVTVIGGLALAAVIGGVALVRERVGGRSDVRFLAKVTDFGDPIPGFITWRNGLILDVEVHVLRAQPGRDHGSVHQDSGSVS